MKRNSRLRRLDRSRGWRILRRSVGDGGWLTTSPFRFSLLRRDRPTTICQVSLHASNPVLRPFLQEKALILEEPKPKAHIFMISGRRSKGTKLFLSERFPEPAVDWSLFSPVGCVIRHLEPSQVPVSKATFKPITSPITDFVDFVPSIN